MYTDETCVIFTQKCAIPKQEFCKKVNSVNNGMVAFSRDVTKIAANEIHIS